MGKHITGQHYIVLDLLKFFLLYSYVRNLKPPNLKTLKWHSKNAVK